ncbi:MAG: hypothetical protein STHCBS139747_000704 [Sporothrix thermara]
MATSLATSDAATAQAAAPTSMAPVRLPRVAIQFCTQCKWMLRAAYFAQELLSTFGPALGEVALQPATGGVFTVTIETAADTGAAAAAAVPFLLWDRKVEGGFPETKELKRRVRDVIAPGRNLGHVDRNYGGEKGAVAAAAESKAEAAPVPNPAKTESEDKKDPAAPFCEDCQ